MSYLFNDTIAAIATAAGGAARGIVRLSGPDVLDYLNRCFQPEGVCHLEEVRYPQVVAGIVNLRDARAELPCQLYYWPTERSYTRAPTAELHTFGSPPLLEELLLELCAAGARLARPGEFTLRAYMSGRIDLTQAEAVLGVIDSRERDDLDMALQQLAGGLAGPLNRLRSNLLDLLAELEAGLDFAEEDIEFISRDELHSRLLEAGRVVSSIARQMTWRGQTSGEPTVALVGWPNVGKSSLMNALCGDEAAIVSRHAGTTRDYLTTRIDVGGLVCRLIDTAGVDHQDRESDEAAAAQQMRREQQRQCDVQLLCIDTTRPLNTWEQGQLSSPPDTPRLIVLTKTDAAQSETDLPRGLATSSKTLDGLDLLRRAIAETLSARQADSQVVAGTAVRCRESLIGAAESLTRGERLVGGRIAGGGEELVAAELRIALHELGKIVGAVYTDDVLDRIFSRFCIGK